MEQVLSELSSQTREVSLKFQKNRNNRKIPFHSTIPARVQFLRARKSNATWLILELLNISAFHGFYLRDD